MMRFPKSICIRNSILLYASVAAAFPAPNQHPFNYGSHEASVPGNHNVSVKFFAELEEFARLVDIAYCVGVTGIQAPFECASRCDEFPGYQLVDVRLTLPLGFTVFAWLERRYVTDSGTEQTWNTGPLMSDSCGYIALDHGGKRIIVAFRGTYSIMNTIVDLATIPQEYVPYPGDPDDDPDSDAEELPSHRGLLSRPWRWFKKAKHRFASWSSGRDGLSCTGQGKGPVIMYGDYLAVEDRPEGPKCANCTVHMGFFSSWKDCRRLIVPHLKHLHKLHPSYKLHLVGHSLGGAVAALAALETEVMGWHPTVTTFGEPRIGNSGLRDYLNALFKLDGSDNEDGNGGRYRRMTHSSDPVPLLPLTEWGYKMHSGEIYISKPELQPSVPDLRVCDGDEDRECIFGGEANAPFAGPPGPEPDDGAEAKTMKEQEMEIERLWGFPARYRIWQLFFAHRDYFWRLGLCVKGGDPIDWGRRYDNLTEEESGEPELVG
jgi:hypothetical protein